MTHSNSASPNAATKDQAVTRLKEISALYSKGILVETEDEYESFFAILRERDALKETYNLSNNGDEKT